jgi:hypothetical protein
VPVIVKSSIDYTLNWTTVCNYALNRIGVAAVVDLSEGTVNSELCNRFLPNAVQHLLNEYDWNFARKRIRPSPLAEKPLFGWKVQFQLPVDLMRIIKVYGTRADTVSDADRIDYQIEGRLLLCGTEDIEIVYINRPLTADQIPYHFADALAAYLAYLLAPAVTGSEQLIAMTAQQMQQQVEQAKRIDAMQNPAPDFDGEPWYAEARN